MSNHATEIEVKLHTPDLTAIQARLEALNATLITPRTYEHNVRYEDASHSLTPAGIVLRLRQDDRVRLTYKGANRHRTDGLSEREELEVTLSDFDTMQAILAQLGYHPHMTYEKYRTTYHLDSCEVVLDEMPYGNFTEIEGEPDAIQTLIQRLDLAHATRYTASYAQIFEHVRRHLNLDFHDLTFANFANINVPSDALRPPTQTERRP